MKKRKKYIYTNKKHSDAAIMSLILGIISAVSMIIVIYLTYLKNGETKGGYGMTGLLAVIFSLIGFVLGANSLQEKDRFKIYSIVGTVLNLLVLVGVGFVVYMGQI